MFIQPIYISRGMFEWVSVRTHLSSLPLHPPPGDTLQRYFTCDRVYAFTRLIYLANDRFDDTRDVFPSGRDVCILPYNQER